MAQFKLNATIAKARAMWGKRLKFEDYTQMMNCRSVGDVAEFLRSKAYYSEALSGVDSRSVHRGYLESLIRKSVFDRYFELCNFQNISKLPFFDFYLRHYEISELLKFIMYMYAGSAEHFMSSVPNFLFETATYDIAALANAKNEEELFKAIKGTPYYDIIHAAGKDSRGRINYPRCEVLLRTYYLSELQSIVEKTIRGAERDELIAQIKQQVDLINIINSYRLKVFFNMDYEEVKEHMLPFKGRMTKNQQEELLNSQGSDEFINAFSRSIYGRQLESSGITHSFFEENISKLRATSAKRALMSAQGVSLCLYCLCFLFEIEAENIVTIIEGIRYGKSPDVIGDYVIY